ncbi:hypothetical protein O181_080364 [Austropuccinia psidii MF-1]|uniref:Uncharacterized protein n=1 Tax=Austropuccinia psidii MF-1 TaxID=1389203 RepID=A0A9Q3FKR7_9BASI|nr:hypothetical protein [Austropuccinia psidii MF-1]
MGVAAILAWDQVGANWPHHIFYGQLAPSGALCSFGHTTFAWPCMSPIIFYGLRPYPAIIGLLGQFPPSPTPGLGVLLSSSVVFHTFLPVSRNFLEIKSWKIKIPMTNSGNHHSKDMLKITKNPGITSTVGRNGRF